VVHAALQGAADLIARMPATFMTYRRAAPCCRRAGAPHHADRRVRAGCLDGGWLRDVAGAMAGAVTLLVLDGTGAGGRVAAADARLRQAAERILSWWQRADVLAANPILRRPAPRGVGR